MIVSIFLEDIPSLAQPANITERRTREGNHSPLQKIESPASCRFIVPAIRTIKSMGAKKGRLDCERELGIITFHPGNILPSDNNQ